MGAVACNKPVNTAPSLDATVTEMPSDRGVTEICEPNCQGRECGVDPRCGSLVESAPMIRSANRRCVSLMMRVEGK